ncbi:MAG: Trk system potassium transporter TrkA [Rhodobacterales bacterium]|nr:MAG: Trk system potassium transporter TrkA [Rhodobacterales bacterium]
MKVIICGAGQVGWQIARHLSGEDNDVTVVDSNPALVHRATETLQVQGIAGFASHPDILEQAGARDTDMIIAATYSDEVNMVTCQVAHSVFEVPRKIARVRSQSYLASLYSDLYSRDNMPIDVVISPEREVAAAALQRFTAPSAFDTEHFLEDKSQLLGMLIEADCPVLNTPLRELTDQFSTLSVNVAGIRRQGRLFVPQPQDHLEPEDEIYVFTHTPDVPRTLEVFGKSNTKQERIVIVGGGNVGLAVAQELERRPHRVRAKVIEQDRKRAEVAADALEKTIVLHGDGLSIELLEEAGITRADAILCVTDDDKTNVLASVRAKAEGCPLAICLVNDPSLISLMTPMGIDAYINPRATTVSSILRHIRHGRVRAVYSVGDAEAEVIEAQVLSTSSIAGQKIADIDFPPGVRVGAIMQQGGTVRPRGSTRINEGDVIVLFALSGDVPEVESLLQVSIDFF